MESVVAIVTPFLDSKEIDKQAFINLLSLQLDNGTGGILVAGTTGESPTLTSEEKLRLLQIAKQRCETRAPVYIGTGTNCTKNSVDLTNKARDLGADGALVVVPYYNKPSFEGIYRHFAEIAKVGLPLIVYHHPGRTGITLSPHEVTRLCEIENVFAYKESSSDLDSLESIISKVNQKIFSGEDFLLSSMISKGAVGSISVMANLIPSDWINLIKASKGGRVKEVERLEKQYRNLLEAVFSTVNPVGIKYALSLTGLIKSNVRLPLVEPDQSIKERIRSEMENLKII